LYHGKPDKYWKVQVNAADATASNEANSILNAEIIPNLTQVMFHDTNDSALKLALVDKLNDLPGIEILFMPAQDRREAAAYELGYFGPAARSAVPALLEVLNGNDEAVHKPAVISLGCIRAEPATVIPALMRCLNDDYVNIKAVSALGQFGAAARAAVPQIIILMQANDPETKWAAGEALTEIDPDAYARARNAVQGTTNSAVVKEAGAMGTTSVK
jgi:HEAT repeat protein